MRYFALHDLQHVILALFLGIASVIAVYLAWGSYSKTRRYEIREEEWREKEGHELKGGHRSEDNPIAPFLILTYTLIAVWCIAYFIFRGVLGGPVG